MGGKLTDFVGGTHLVLGGMDLKFRSVPPMSEIMGGKSISPKMLGGDKNVLGGKFHFSVPPTMGGK